MEIGEKHNLLTAIRFVERKNWRPYWLFKCECGGDKIASASNVLYGNIKSCGCLKRSQEIDITGKKYGLLTAIEKHGSKRDSKGQPFWTFTCECGNSKDIIKHAVTSGKSKSCGCQKSVASGKDHWAFKGGDRNMKTNKLYRAYRSILQRCNNVDSDGYFRYGGRGIKVLWEAFEDFKMDMDSWIKRVKKAKTIKGKERIVIPGEPEAEMEKYRKINGFNLDAQVIADLAQLAAKFSIPF